MLLEPLPNPDWALLARYFAGECTSVEIDRIEAWLAGASERRAEMDQLREIWRQSAELLPNEDVETALMQIKARGAEPAVLTLPIRAGTGEARVRSSAVPSRNRWFRSLTRWPQAVAALLVLAVGVIVWQFERERQVPVASQELRMTDVATKRGERARLRLPDGSKVVLAPTSQIRFAENFGIANRELYLEGEAYFEAVHDDTKPLRVRTQQAVVQDIGTAFVVRAYAGTPMQVAVSEGAVRLDPERADRSERVVLTLAERGTVRNDGSILHERGIDLGPEIGWTEGRLVFANTPLRDAIPRLSRWFDLDIHLADPRLGDLRLNVTFDRDTASEVLQLIGLILELRVERHGSAVVLHGKDSHS